VCFEFPVTKLFGGLSFAPSTQGLLSLTSGGRKNKRTELGDRRLPLCHEKVEDKRHSQKPPPGQNVGAIGTVDIDDYIAISLFPICALRFSEINLTT